MPPKKAQSDKSVKKDKAKQVDDKTFGLKNKNRSAKVNRYVQQVKQQVETSGNRKDMEKEQRKKELERKKDAELARKAELAELFKVAQIQQKVPFGTDPKTVLCVNFKNGHCAKGDKCRFSHDPNIGRKRDKIDLYTDQRGTEKEEDTMDQWDQSKLETVVMSKHGNPRVSTEIVCKYFLESIDNGKYGWFWECPNGGNKCIYRHALPPGFVLKSRQQRREEEEAGRITLEEFLETERLKLGKDLTPVTLETFTEWKRTRMERKKAEATAARSKKEAAFRAGKNMQVSGRELFDFNPDLVNDGDWGDGDDGDAFDIAGMRAEQEKAEEAAEAAANAATTGMASLAVDEDLFAKEEDLGDLDE